MFLLYHSAEGFGNSLAAKNRVCEGKMSPHGRERLDAGGRRWYAESSGHAVCVAREGERLCAKR